MTYAIIVVIPMVLVWVVVIIDILARRDLSPLWKAGWAVTVTVVWPTMLLYLLLRPVQGRLVSARQVRRQDSDPQQRLVQAVLDRRAGRIDPDLYRETVRQLRDDKSP